MPTLSPDAAKVVAAVNKKFGAGTVMLGSEIQHDLVPRVPSGSLALDVILGGGWPANQWHEIIGEECLAPGTRILGADLIWHRIEDMHVGQEIVGFDEVPSGRGQGRSPEFEKGRITALGRAHLDCFEIRTEYGTTVASAGHLWLVERGGQRTWVRTDGLTERDRIAAIGAPWETDTSYEAGYIAGFYDGEGWLDNGRVRVAQVYGPTLDNALLTLEKLGYTPHVNRQKFKTKPTWQDKATVILPGRYSDLHLIGSTRPTRLLAKAESMWVGKSTRGPRVPVLSVRAVGVREVVTIGTSCKTLVADGMLSHNSHGKTALALKTIAANQERDPLWTAVWIAAEQWVPSYAAMLGVDTSRVIVVETNVMEEAYDAVIAFVESKAVDCVVLDSLPALVPGAEDEKDMDENTVGRGALLTGKFFRKVGKATKRSMLEDERPILGLIINQFRQKIGVMHGDPRTTPGGLGKNYSFFVRVEVRRDEWIEIGSSGSKTRIGQAIKCRTIKNKTAPPQQVAYFDFYFDHGGAVPPGSYDFAKEIVSVGILREVIERRGGWFYYADRKWQGAPALLESIREEITLKEQLETDVLDSVRAERLVGA